MSSSSHAISTTQIEAGGLTFETDICGSGDRLALCLHGFPEHAISWRHQLPVLASLGYEAWAPNLRGYGKSSRPIGVENYSIDKLIGDVAALIDASGKEEVVLIAHDWGAIIAWTFAIRKIRPLNKLVIMNVPHPTLFARGLKTWRQLKRSQYMFFFQIPGLPERLLARNGAEAIGKAFLNMAIDKDRFPPDIIDFYRKNALEPGALTAMINYYRAAFRSRLKNNLAGPDVPMVALPTMIVWGEEDTALGKEMTYGTEEFVPDLTLRYLPNVSHWVQQEAPEIVNAMLSAFLTGNDVPMAETVAQHP